MLLCSFSFCIHLTNFIPFAYIGELMSWNQTLIFLMMLLQNSSTSGQTSKIPLWKVLELLFHAYYFMSYIIIWIHHHWRSCRSHDEEQLDACRYISIFVVQLCNILIWVLESFSVKDLCFWKLYREKCHSEGYLPSSFWTFHCKTCRYVVIYIDVSPLFIL